MRPIGRTSPDGHGRIISQPGGYFLEVQSMSS
jgi:hypothetical protein